MAAPVFALGDHDDASYCINLIYNIQYIAFLSWTCNDIAKHVKRNEKICKKQLTFIRGFDIIILALSVRAKLIESH